VVCGAGGGVGGAGLSNRVPTSVLITPWRLEADPWDMREIQIQILLFS